MTNEPRQTAPLTLPADWQQRDHNMLWHPYANTGTPCALAAVTRARGCHLTLEDGREVVDGMSSWWCAIHGYNHPVLNQAIESQIQSMAHVMFGGLTHAPAIGLATRLLKIAGDGLDRVFLADSGSVAVEVAAKMALQYQFALGQHERRKLMTVRGGYYGDTTGAMSLCDPVNGMHGHFHGAILEQVFAPAPQMGEASDNADIDALVSVVERQGEHCAALILEPLVQGAGGMRFYRPEYVLRACEIAREAGMLVIFDEIATGFGRTGSMFAMHQCGVVPDILCLGKALTGGYMTLSAVLAGAHVPQVIENDEPGLFMHGPTFMANPLACSVACASIDLLLDSPWQNRVAAIAEQLTDQLSSLGRLPGVEDVRVRGAIGVVELSEAIDTDSWCQAFLKQGVWIRPFRNLIYLMPPFIITTDELQQLTNAVLEQVARWSDSRKTERRHAQVKQ